MPVLNCSGLLPPLLSAVEDFGALLRREEHKTVSQVESAAANERWEDPEYQAKQIAARARRHNKRE